MGLAIFLFLALTLLSTTRAELNPIGQLRQPSSESGELLDCLSWRLAVESHNIRHWSSVPESCVTDIEVYMFAGQYHSDCDTMAIAAAEYAKTFPISDNGTDVWVFDVDDTMLSNLLFFSGPHVQYGKIPVNATLFYEWVKEGAAPPLAGILRLYKTVLSLGFGTVILSGASESIREYRVASLKKAGYDGWDILFLREEDDMKKSQEEYKSEKRSELVKKGYRIVGNVGDQWSDLVGEYVGNRTFKVPNPMYYSP